MIPLHDHAHGHDHVDAHDHNHGHEHVLSHDHGHHHGHDHSHVPANTSTRRLGIVVTLTLVIFFAELIGGLISNSLALLADAGHMLTDAAGLILALIAALVGKRGATTKATYGYRRVEVLTALINGLSIVVIGVVIAWEAIARIGTTPEINTTQMLVIAVIGLVANLIGMVALAQPAKDSMNVLGAYLHVLIDAAGSVAVIISALVIAATGWAFVDSIVSLLIAVLIIPRAVTLIRGCIEVLMEHTPHNANIEQIRADLLDLEDVVDLHDLHVWSVSGNETLLSVHLVADSHEGCSVLDAAQSLLRTKHHIEHATVQIEPAQHSNHEPGAHCF